MRHVVSVFLVMLAAASVAGEKPDLAQQQREKMELIEFLAGEWEGEGWIKMGPEASHFRGRESVVSRLDGLVLDIEGVHESADESRKGQVVHHALARVTWDEDEQAYRFRSHLADGRSGDHLGRMVDDDFVWSIEMPGRMIRYTITLDDQGRWFEVGEMQVDGGEPMQFFEMTLRRVGE